MCAILRHAGPFANIAHGNSSVVADLLALKLVGADVSDILACCVFNRNCCAHESDGFACPCSASAPELASVVLDPTQSTCLECGFVSQPLWRLLRHPLVTGRHSIALPVTDLRCKSPTLACTATGPGGDGGGLWRGYRRREIHEHQVPVQRSDPQLRRHRRHRSCFLESAGLAGEDDQSRHDPSKASRCHVGVQAATSVCIRTKAGSHHARRAVPSQDFRGLPNDIAIRSTSVRALKMHGGGPPVTAGKPLDAAYRSENVELVVGGCCNLERHIANSRSASALPALPRLSHSKHTCPQRPCHCPASSAASIVFQLIDAFDSERSLSRALPSPAEYGVPVVVAINRFAMDTEAELDAIKQAALKAGRRACCPGLTCHNCSEVRLPEVCSLPF